MRHKFRYSFKQGSERFKYPIIHIEVRNFGYRFMLDTSVKYNLIDPCFAKDFYEPFPATKEMFERQESTHDLLTGESLPLYRYYGVYQKIGIRTIVCKDSVKRSCEMINFEFAFEDVVYNEKFYIDKSFCLFNKMNGFEVGAVLGLDFLKKHKWIIDYNRLEIYSKNYYGKLKEEKKKEVSVKAIPLFISKKLQE